MQSEWRYSLHGTLEELSRRLSELRDGRRSVIVTEEQCLRHCISRIPSLTADIVLPAGEATKTPEQLLHLWQELTEAHLSRHDLLVAVGGGALLDIAGLAAATYKRGMQVIYLPTTLLADVDAALGGKTAIDLGELKNAIGTFYMPEEVLICPAFLSTLPAEELLSGWGEVLKYALLDRIDLPEEKIGTAEIPLDLLKHCIDYKIEVVKSDPLDRGGRRQYLNLGHTLGHALESLTIKRGDHTPHGIAVAAGLVIEGYLSLRRDKLPQEELMTLARLVKDHFPPISLMCTEYDTLYALCLQDKKAVTGEGAPVVMLEGAGHLAPAEYFTQKEIEEAVDFYRDYMQV